MAQITPIVELSPLYGNHPLLREIQQRDYEIARLSRQLAAADGRNDHLKSMHRQVVAAFRRRLGEEVAA